MINILRNVKLNYFNEYLYNRQAVLDVILGEFAGPADTGVFSASVQYTQYVTTKSVMKKVPQVLCVLCIQVLYV